MDTRNKRSSALLIGLPFRGLYPAPDGAVGEEDRPHVALMYAGLAAGEPPAPPTGRRLTSVNILTDITTTRV